MLRLWTYWRMDGGDRRVAHNLADRRFMRVRCCCWRHHLFGGCRDGQNSYARTCLADNDWKLGRPRVCLLGPEGFCEVGNASGVGVSKLKAGLSTLYRTKSQRTTYDGRFKVKRR